MYYATGRINRKSRVVTDISTTLDTTLHRNNLGVVVETYASGGPVVTLQRSESIVYSQRSKRFPKRSNFCAHNRFSLMKVDGVTCPRVVLADLNPAHAGWTWEVCWDYPTSYNAHIVAVSTALQQLGSYGLGKLQANWMSYAATGFQACQPDLTKLSVPNFLIDIGQLRALGNDVLPLVRSKANSAFFTRTQVQEEVLGWLKLGKEDKFKTASKLVAEKRLSYKFGWSPTVGDVASFVSGITSLKKRLDAFKINVGKELSFTKTIEKVEEGKSGQFNYLSDIHQKVNWDGILNGKVQYHAKYVPQPLAAIGPLDEAIRGYMDTFGVELNPQILWDAIPFSFVLDWFLGVGKFLSRFKVDALTLPILMTDSAVSYKEEYIVSSRLTSNPNGYPTDVTAPNKLAGYTTHNRFFHRMPLDPSIPYFHSLGWRNPTSSQWINFVSLATVLGL